MLGAIIGDIVGSRFEWNNNKSKEFNFFDSKCFITDDSIMTLAIANAVIECNCNYSKLGINAIKYMKQLGMLYPNSGYGINFNHWLNSKDSKPYNSYGNGAAMRVSPIAYISKTMDEVKLYSKLITEITHNHPEGIKGAEAVSIAIWMAINKYNKHDIKKHIEDNYYKLNFIIDEIRDSYSFDVTCKEQYHKLYKPFLNQKILKMLYE